MLKFHFFSYLKKTCFFDIHVNITGEYAHYILGNWIITLLLVTVESKLTVSTSMYIILHILNFKAFCSQYLINSYNLAYL